MIEDARAPGLPVHRFPSLYALWRRARLSAPGRAFARARAGRVTRRRLERHAARAEVEADPSYAGEWPHLAALLARLRPRERFVVDLAAGDGVTSSCTLPLFRDHGWAGLAVECDAARFRLLAHAYRRFADVRLSDHRVTPADAAAVLARAGTPRELGVLNLDLDSFDLVVAEALLAEFRPIVVDMEVNEKVPPPIRFAVRYTPDFRWDEGHCYGCSICAAANVLGRAGYILEALVHNNAFFVRADAAAAVRITPLAPALAYRTGYLERPDRRQLFPWNVDVDELPAMPPADGVDALRRRFGRVRADFALQLEPLAPGWAEAAGR